MKEYCPICGKLVVWSRHACDERTLRAIDGAHKRDVDAIQERRKPWGQRLSDGMDILLSSIKDC